MCVYIYGFLAYSTTLDNGWTSEVSCET